MKKAEIQIDHLIQKQSLPADYKDLVGDYLWPLAEDMAALYAVRSAAVSNAPWLVGLQGTQGSGKSTVSLFIKTLLQQCFDLNVVVLSIDDFYNTHQERIELSNTVHPLLCTRGVPGTHDVDLIFNTLTQLSELKSGQTSTVPSFNKAMDDRSVQSQWPQVSGKVDIILFEGWCMGLPAQSSTELLAPLNDLEKNEDRDASWRTYVNQKLVNEYAEIFNQLEELIVLQAPSFECVYSWRLLQEEKLQQKMQALTLSCDDQPLRIQTPEQIQRFISHYERLTRHGLAVLPEKASWVLTLDENHNMTSLFKNNNSIRLA